MKPWIGRVPTACLNDQQIRPTEYTRWADARERFARRPKDKKILDDLKASIPRNGLTVPIILGISERYPDDVYVCDGHHRAIALIDLGVAEFAFQWYWIRSFGVRMEQGPFPYYVLGL
ncbi:ParB N-terminal domain-containing protein [Streptomyces diastatochromogenes]|uniref:ParB N-terminal domain-containing protein n=1 Tax=Streptomyces diastatochromogenes TaxID=42236 RepID=UPI002F26AB18